MSIPSPIARDSAARISASFLDFSERTNECGKPLAKDQTFWDAELQDLRAAGISDIVIARSVVQGRAHYHSALFEEWQEADAVAMVMRAAAEHGLGVYLGLDLNTCFWDRSRDFARLLRRDLQRNRLVLDELLSAYRGHPALRGIYISNEPDRDNLDTPERADALRGFLGDIYRTVKEACALRVFCSPFFSKSLPPAELARWWDAFVDRPNETIIATLLAWQLTGDQKYARMHRLVHDWSHRHFADPKHGEWYGYLHRDGRVSVPLKGNLWKSFFHHPRMQWYASRLCEEMGAQS